MTAVFWIVFAIAALVSVQHVLARIADNLALIRRLVAGQVLEARNGKHLSAEVVEQWVVKS